MGLKCKSIQMLWLWVWETLDAVCNLSIENFELVLVGTLCYDLLCRKKMSGFIFYVFIQ